MAGGRPSTYTTEQAEAICERVSSGELFTHVLRDMDLAVSTLYQWLHANDEFAELYAKAREIQADVHADSIVGIADLAEAGDVQVARLRVDARKWVASKLRPRTWGDKVDLNVSGQLEVMEIDFGGYEEHGEEG